VLLYGQSSGQDNGIYDVTTVGDGSTAAVLTRSADADSSSELQSAACFVDQGDQATTAFVQTSDSITTNSTSLVFVQFSSASIVAGNGLAKSGSTLSVNAGTGLEISGDNVQIQSGAVTETQLASSAFSAAGALTGGGGSAAAVSVDGSSISISSNQLTIAAGGVTSTEINASACGNGLTGGGGSAIAIGAGNGIAVDTSTVALSNSFTVTGDITANSLSSSSDATLKTDIEECSNALLMEKCMQLSPCTYRFKENQSEWRCGFIAQKVAAVAPEFVVTDSNGLLGLRYAEMVSMLCGAVKHLAAQVDELESKMGE
jgi:hypothetical protein